MLPLYRSGLFGKVPWDSFCWRYDYKMGNFSFINFFTPYVVRARERESERVRERKCVCVSQRQAAERVSSPREIHQLVAA